MSAFGHGLLYRVVDMIDGAYLHGAGCDYETSAVSGTAQRVAASSETPSATNKKPSSPPRPG